MTPLNGYSRGYEILEHTIDDTTTQKFPLSKLPTTLIERIAALAYGPNNAASFLSLKAVSKDFRDLDITPLRRRQWEILRAATVFGIIDIPSEMRHIEKMYVDKPVKRTDRYTEHFRRLQSVFNMLLPFTEWGKPVKTTPDDYIELQGDLEDRQLKECWPEIKRQISCQLGFFAGFYWIPKDDADAQTIRSFLGKDRVKQVILSVESLRLNNRGLISLPKELTLFTNLKELILSNNQFLSLPAHAFVKRMRDPALPFVYNEVPAFPHLQTLEIGSYNRLSASPFREVKAIPSIRFFPSLTHISFEIESLTSLASLEKRLGRDGTRTSRSLTISLKGSKVYEYMMDKLYHPAGTYEINYDIIHELKSYNPTSPLGHLYHTILYTETTMEGLKGLVYLLDEGDANCLYYSIWKYSIDDSKFHSQLLHWGRENCFTDEHLFRRCIGLSIKEKFMQIMALQQLSQVYQSLWDQFEQEERLYNEEWILSNRFNNYARLADAMSRIQLNRIVKTPC